MAAVYASVFYILMALLGGAVAGLIVLQIALGIATLLSGVEIVVAVGHQANAAVLLIAIMLRFMDNFRFIDSILVLTGGGPGNATKILPVYLFEVSFKFFKLGRGAAIALILLIVTIILGKLLVRVFDRQQPSKV